MRTGTFHTFDRYISSEHTSFLVYKEVLVRHMYFRKAGHDLWMGMGTIAFAKKKGENRELV